VRPVLLLMSASLLAVGTSVAAAQDVEMLARHYGTQPPDGYYRTLANDPTAFRFRRGRSLRIQARMSQTTGAAGPLATLGRREGPVTGTFVIPVILGLFSDTNVPPPYTADTIRTRYFGDGPGTVTAFYTEISGGKVTFLGDPMGWVRSGMTGAQATGGQSGLVSGTTALFVSDLVSKVQGVDWGQYDNDGPDGIPNSGDDDGYVDALAVFQPSYGAECDNSTDHIWSHKWSLSGGGAGVDTTSTPSVSGGFIKIDDYFIQPIYACDKHSLDQIGVFSHESGHAFGLPDLYDTWDNDGVQEGDGNWDLMASGAWGCDGRSPQSPCHMGAWSKSVLGWVDVQTLPGGTDLGTLSLAPVESSGQVYRIDAEDGSGDYYLLANRQPIGFDNRLLAAGLLIWQIDPEWIAQHWASNTVNGHNAHLGVWLRQADGLDQLTTPGGNRGDAGDPFPGQTGNHVFHAGSDPSSATHLGTPSGMTVLDIQGGAQLPVQLHLSTRLSRISVSTLGDSGSGGLLTVNGAPVAGTADTLDVPPFVIDTIEASVGEAISSGVREPFVDWTDDTTVSRKREIVTPMQDTSFVARYSGRQVELAMEVTGGVDGVTPATFQSTPASPDLWFDEGADVQIEAVPIQGFSFVAWSGALAGKPNPADITMSEPLQAGASFELTYAVPSVTLQITGGEAPSWPALQVENGTAPVVWTIVQGPLPDGLEFYPSGIFRGAAMELGTFPLSVRGTDANGLAAEGSVTLQVSKPVLPVDQLASPLFGVGPSLTALEQSFLDRQGNRNGSYDLGDFRAWVLANPDLPATAKSKQTSTPGGPR